VKSRSIAHPTPDKGEHTDEILKAYGYDDKSIAEFRKKDRLKAVII
jgi:crotonobetainyl-CoA:carnitine CoA-transferase CaiB-like acyl-CoA transferase